MEGYLFYGQRAFFVFIEMSIVLIAAALMGFAFGRVISRRVEDRAQVGAVQASVLGLLALMLGFTFAAASTRYDARRLLGVDEANALGTTFLRAQTLPEPYRTTMSRMLHDYIDLRAESISLSSDTKKLMRIKGETEKLQQEMWGQAASAARRRNAKSPVLTNLLKSELIWHY